MPLMRLEPTTPQSQVKTCPLSHRLFVLVTYTLVDRFSVMLGHVPFFLGLTSTKQRKPPGTLCISSLENSVDPDQLASDEAS